MGKTTERQRRVSVVAALSTTDTFLDASAKTLNNNNISSYPPPTSARQWVEVSLSCLQNNTAPVRRLMRMLEVTAQALLDEESQGTNNNTNNHHHLQHSKRGSISQNKVIETDESDEYSSPEVESLSTTPPPPANIIYDIASPKRWLAARFFLLGSRLGLKRGTSSSLRAAVRLAESAVAAHRCPFTTTHLAWACYYFGLSLQERGGVNNLQEMTRELVLGTSEIIISGSSNRGGIILPTETLLISKLAWLMALLGETQRALSLMQLLVKQNRAEVDALILLSLLYSTTGDYDKALNVAYHAEQLHPQYIVGGVIFTTMRYLGNDAQVQQNGGVEELLVVILARVRAAAQYASELSSSNELNNSPDIISTVIADGSWSSHREAVGRVAGHWALLAFIALEINCESIAEIAVEAGLEYISSAIEEHRQAFSDLVCCGARLKINRIEKLVETLHRRQNGVGITDNNNNNNNNNKGAAAELHEIEDERLVQEQRVLLDSSEILSLRTMLGKALEVKAAHAESFLLLGRLYLLEALKADQPHSLCLTKLVEAAHYFQSAIRCNPTLTEAYEGMGRVREAQGAIEVSLSFFSSAAELAYRQPAIPFERFLYLLN